MERLSLHARIVVLIVAGAGCSSPVPVPQYDGGLAVHWVSQRFDVANAMRAAYEMQLSGEPFAQLLGYNLAGFNRSLSTTDQYDPDGGGTLFTDPLGYALAIESYEYSKQPMNNLSFESGAGLSLMFGPVLNPAQVTRTPAVQLLTDRFQKFAAETSSGGPAGKNLIVSPPPKLNPLNYYGWPGLWPVFAEFESFDPSIEPSPGRVNHCLFGGGNATGSIAYGGAIPPGGLLIANYECDYNSLNLDYLCGDGLNACRDRKVTKSLTPAALGYATWKQGLWSITYWGAMHDSAGNGISDLANPSDGPMVGQPGNTVVGVYPDPADPLGIQTLQGAPGLYLGDIPMEGWQGLTMMDEIDNKAALVLSKLMSRDGATLTGLSIADADAYSYDSPLAYFPAAVGVTETTTTIYPIERTQYFPEPSSFTISDGSSSLAGLSGLLGGFAEAFAFTDGNNPQVGGATPFQVTFDGDPFPRDDGLPDGENTLHDRALGILKVALVDLDRLHFDPVAKVFVDGATVSGGAIHRGTTVTTVELAELILALRNAFRGLNGSLQLYSNDTPDGQNVPSALDTANLSGAPYAGLLASHITALIGTQADFLASHLVQPDGTVANSFDLTSNTPDPSPTLLEAETGAIRGLLDAYLATSKESYRKLAIAVYANLQARFWMADIRCFRTTVGVDDLMQFTPIRFGLLSGALRQYYKLVASAPARKDEGVQLLAEMKRSYKLVLNGWDDVNQDDRLQYPQECVGAGLQMGERMLTGELGHLADNGDRDSDCVKEISVAGLPAALGSELDIRRAVHVE